MKKTKNIKTFSKLDFVDEEGRHDIYNWSERRQRKYQGFRKSLHILQIYAFNTHLLRSFVENFNFMVILQMTLAAFITYLCDRFQISYDVHVSLFISPIVFPLAFSINTDFQRKEKVLEDLANFKSSAMMWFFCMRDWREACSMDLEYMKAVRNKIKGIVFHLREYLLTEKLDRRKFIVRVIYEDLSDANQLNEKVRCSSLPANSPLVARIIHFVNMMCLSFERLRVIREYRSPRSIRSFTKVLIFILPLLLSPYYVYLGTKLVQNSNADTIRSSTWSPYYISIMVAFVFGALQGVQDKLDDPFDGMSEDDINLDTLDEWTLQSLEATCHRAYKIGRFQVVSSNMDGGKPPPPQPPTGMVDPLASFDRGTKEDLIDELELGYHKYAGVLNNIQGNMTILRGGRVKKREKSFDDLGNLDRKSRFLSQALFSEQQNNLQSLFSEQSNLQDTMNVGNLPYNEEDSETIRIIPSLNRLPSVDIIESDGTCIPTSTLDFADSETPTYGVASYLASVRRNNMSLRGQLDRQLSRNGSVSSNLSKRGSRSSVGSASDVINDKAKAEFFIGDELVNRLSPIYQDVSSGRFSVSNGSVASINPLLLNMHQNSEEDTDDDDDDDDDDENVPMELTSLFENIQRRNSMGFENFQQRNSPINDLTPKQYPFTDNIQSKSTLNVENFRRSNSPVFLNMKRSNSLSVNNLQNNLQNGMRRNSSLASLATNPHQSSPLLKASNSNLSNTLSPKPKSRFTVSKSSTSVNIDVNDETPDDITLTKLKPDVVLQNPKFQSSPKTLNPVLRSNNSTASVNPLILNMYQNSDEDADDEDLPIELSDIPLFSSLQQVDTSPVIEKLEPHNSPSSENLHKLNENLQMRNSPLFDNREISNIPIFDTLSPKSKQRFIINGVGKNEHSIIDNGHVMQNV